MTTEEKIIYVDGGCSGNPGPMRFAMVCDDFKLVGNGNHGTNNIAEYHALIYALVYARYLTEDIIIKSDSKLVVEQVNRRWKVNDPKLQPLCHDARILIELRQSLFDANTQLIWIPRDQNLAGKLLEQGGR